MTSASAWPVTEAGSSHVWEFTVAVHRHLWLGRPTLGLPAAGGCGKEGPHFMGQNWVTELHLTAGEAEKRSIRVLRKKRKFENRKFSVLNKYIYILLTVSAGRSPFCGGERRHQLRQ